MEKSNIKEKTIFLNRFFLLVARGLGIISIFMNDVDKSPIYFLLAYIFWRLN